MTADTAPITWRQRIKRIVFFFPFQLVLLHVKKNHFLLFFWVLLFGITLSWIGSKYGIQHQFLYPEYRGETNFVSFAILGFSMGGFVVAFNLYTYILHGFRFPFIATLSRPFLKFSINNFILPAIYLGVYIFISIDYQINQELNSAGDVMLHLSGFVFGMITFLILSAIYFSFTNKSALNFEPRKKRRVREETENPVSSRLHKPNKWYAPRWRFKRWHVETYMSGIGRIALARKSLHYDKEILEKVFSQNHINASLFEFLLIITFIVIGSFRENSFFVIPAAASVFLLFTTALMIVSAIFSWIKGWTITVFVVAFLAVNFSPNGINFLAVPNHAYGLDYNVEKAPYSDAVVDSINRSIAHKEEDFQHTLEILDNWRRKHSAETIRTGKKPKLVLVNASGGGLRASLWTLSSMLAADSILDGDLMEHTFMITGSSGGMIGAAYMRELYFKRSQGLMVNPYSPKYRENIAKDLLNPVIFSVATNDVFIRYQRFTQGTNVYTKDRAYSFEKQLNVNTEYFLNKRLIDYAKPEREATIPMMVFTPTIINDGRRLIISSQPVSYLCKNIPPLDVLAEPLAEDVEFSRMFVDQFASNLRFTSALRMNATFPYILPTVTLPTEPPIDVMDAGLRDNFGIKTSLQFLYEFRNWINTNTSGVVILQVRDIQKDFKARTTAPTLVDQFTAPLGSMYGNFTRMQDYNADQMIRYFSTWYEADVDFVTLQLFQEQESKISLSWHLTEAEKRRVNEAVSSEDFGERVEQLRVLLSQE